jgi:CHASE3 domain sensor protein
LLVLSVVASRSIASLVDSADRVAHTHQVLAKLGVVLSLMDEAETSTRGYVITGADRFLEPYHVALAKVRPEAKALRELIADNADQRRRSEILESLIDRKLAICEERVSVRKEKGFEVARQMVLTDRGRQIMDEIRGVIREMEEEENSSLKQRTEVAERNARLSTWIIAGGDVLSLVFMVFALMIINIDISLQRQSEAEKMSLEAQLRERTAVLVNADARPQAGIVKRKG